MDPESLPSAGFLDGFGRAGARASAVGPEGLGMIGCVIGPETGTRTVCGLLCWAFGVFGVGFAGE
jgi:hypothetical protein